MSLLTVKERQKMLQRERQQHCRQLKRQHGKENVPPHPKRRKDDVINESSKAQNEYIYLWISHGSDHHTIHVAPEIFQ
jgi:hypothetical protein